MIKNQLDFQDIHWLMEILQNLDVGLVVLDRDYKVQLWNNFMEGHSGIGPQKAQEKSIFQLFPDIDSNWFKRKTDPVFELHTRAFITWEQRPYLFKFDNYRPVTGQTKYMLQNITIFPLESMTKTVNSICIIVYDVTESAAKQFSQKQ